MSKRKKIIILIISIIFVVALIVGAIFAIKNYLDNKTKQSPATITKKTADSIINKANDAINNKDDDAIQLLKEAEGQYSKLGDSQAAANAQIQQGILEYEAKKANGTLTEAEKSINESNYVPKDPSN